MYPILEKRRLNETTTLMRVLAPRVAKKAGADGELAASMRYLPALRHARPPAGCSTTWATEELAHLENDRDHHPPPIMPPPRNSSGRVLTTTMSTTLPRWMQAASRRVVHRRHDFQSKGDLVTIARRRGHRWKARTTYDNILRLADDPDVIAPSASCASARWSTTSGAGEGLRLVEEALDPATPHARNPGFDA